MSKVFKCDRCGVFYEYDNTLAEDLALTTKLNASKNKFFDLCPRCHCELDGWFNLVDREDAE